MKLARDAFLYMDPKAPRDQFAQCSTCRDWVSGDRRCVIHGPKVAVKGSASCGLYVNGSPQSPQTATYARVTPEESGLVDRQVRCENCHWFDDTDDACFLYRMLNERLGADLDTKVHKQGCCNAQTPGD